MRSRVEATLAPRLAVPRVLPDAPVPLRPVKIGAGIRKQRFPLAVSQTLPFAPFTQGSLIGTPSGGNFLAKRHALSRLRVR